MSHFADYATFFTEQYADLCFQLASVLQLESTDSFDGDYLLSQVALSHCAKCVMQVVMRTAPKNLSRCAPWPRSVVS